MGTEQEKMTYLHDEILSVHCLQRITQNIYLDGTNLVAISTLISIQMGRKDAKMLSFETVQLLN